MQGPHSMAQLQKWMDFLTASSDPDHRQARAEFSGVAVYKVRPPFLFVSSPGVEGRASWRAAGAGMLGGSNSCMHMRSCHQHRLSSTVLHMVWCSLEASNEQPAVFSVGKVSLMAHSSCATH